MSEGGHSVRSWPRPNARRLCQLVLVSPGRRVSRESAYEALFPSLAPEAAARSLYKVQSMARLTLKELGPHAAGLLCADPSQIWADPALALAVDLDAHEEALHSALGAQPGAGRDAALVEALSTGGVPLEDEPEAQWAAPARERVEYLRQEARLELARDRSRGVGRAHPEDVLRAWQACLEADPTDEEAAAALMQLYVAQGRRSLAVAVYESCRAALADLGMKTSPTLEDLRAGAEGAAPLPGHASPLGADAVAGAPAAGTQAGERSVHRALCRGWPGRTGRPRGPRRARRCWPGRGDKRGGASRGHRGVDLRVGDVGALRRPAGTRRRPRTGPALSIAHQRGGRPHAREGRQRCSQRRRSPHRDIRGGVVGPRRGGDWPGRGGADRRRGPGGLRGGRRRRRRHHHPGIGGQGRLGARRPRHPCRHREGSSSGDRARTWSSPRAPSRS